MFLYIIKNGMLIYFDIYRMYFILKDYFESERKIGIEVNSENGSKCDDKEHTSQQLIHSKSK